MLHSDKQDFLAFSDAPPAARLDILFIHHSVGGQWLADPGPLESTTDAKRSLHRTHPNGGGLRRCLEAQGYSVHEASYGSEVGERTDLFDWLPKFRDSMPRILTTKFQDDLLPKERNRIVVFKSCYPNNAFRPEGVTDSGPTSLTLENARFTFTALLAEFARHADVLFVYVTAPPLRDDSDDEPAWKSFAKRVLGRQSLSHECVQAANTARAFNDWVASRDGWLAGYDHRNVVAFDYFDLLAGDSNFLRYPSNRGADNHPTSEAQQLATARFAPFLNRAVRYAGLAP
jgi:hypothetical protein